MDGGVTEGGKNIMKKESFISTNDSIVLFIKQPKL